jgi:integrase/recombinase XerD
VDGGDIRRTFYAQSRQIGLRGPADHYSPRLHDLAPNRHTHWCAGIGPTMSNHDTERKLPLLSTYLGHVHVADTQGYLSGSPELMREAMRRLAHRWEDRP